MTLRLMPVTFVFLLVALVVGSQSFGSFGAYPGVYNVPSPPLTLSLLCAENSCVSSNVKNSIRSSWDSETTRIYDECVRIADGAQCTQSTLYNSVNPCVYQRIQYNTTDPRQVSIDFTYDQLMKCCGDSITLNMLRCSQPGYSGSGSSPYRSREP